MEIGKVKYSNGFEECRDILAVGDYNWIWTNSIDIMGHHYIVSALIGDGCKVGWESKNSLVIYNRI